MLATNAAAPTPTPRAPHRLSSSCRSTLAASASTVTTGASTHHRTLSRHTTKDSGGLSPIQDIHAVTMRTTKTSPTLTAHSNREAKDGPVGILNDG